MPRLPYAISPRRPTPIGGGRQRGPGGGCSGEGLLRCAEPTTARRASSCAASAEGSLSFVRTHPPRAGHARRRFLPHRLPPGPGRRCPGRAASPGADESRDRACAQAGAGRHVRPPVSRRALRLRRRVAPHRLRLLGFHPFRLLTLRDRRCRTTRVRSSRSAAAFLAPACVPAIWSSSTASVTSACTSAAAGSFTRLTRARACRWRR